MRLMPVTVYRFYNGVWQRFVFDRAWVRVLRRTKQENSGRHFDSELTARIFSRQAERILVGDKIVTGRCVLKEPKNAFTVFETADNFILGRGHIRITAR